VRGLTIIVCDSSPARFRAALELSAAQAALGGSARIFVQGAAVSLLRPPVRCDDDEAHAGAGLATLAQLLGEALELGAAIIVCQSGLALTRTDAEALDPRIEAGGLVSLMQALGEDRLLLA
jgi:predicted peroxiredoxin